ERFARGYVALDLRARLPGTERLGSFDAGRAEFDGLALVVDAGPACESFDGFAKAHVLGDHDQVEGGPARTAGMAAPALLPPAGSEGTDRRRLAGLGTVIRGGAGPGGRVAPALRRAEQLLVELGQVGAGQHL